MNTDKIDNIGSDLRYIFNDNMRRDMADYIAEVLCKEDTQYFFFSFNSRAVESWLTPVRISAWHAYWSIWDELFFIEAQEAERNGY